MINNSRKYNTTQTVADSVFAERKEISLKHLSKARTHTLTKKPICRKFVTCGFSIV